MGQLGNKVVVVTGAASGIGQACVTRCLADGARVIGADIAATPQGTNAEFAEVDVCDEAAVDALMQRVATDYGRIDGIVNAAGIAGGGPVHLLDAAAWDRVLDVNLKGTFLVCKHAITRMLAQPAVGGERGSVVTISSVEGLEGTAGGSAYNASKGGVVLLTKNLAIDYGRQGIRANAICPGFIETPMLDGVLTMPGMEPVLASIRHEHKLRRLGRPAEIASVASFLLSSDASFCFWRGHRRRRRLHRRPRSRCHRVDGAVAQREKASVHVSAQEHPEESADRAESEGRLIPDR